MVPMNVPAPALALLLLAGACSGSRVLTRAEIERDMRRIHVLDLETGLFEEIAGPLRMTHTYARGHVRYLYDAAQDYARTLAAATAAPADQAELQRARDNAARLEARYVALMLRIH